MTFGAKVHLGLTEHPISLSLTSENTVSHNVGFDLCMSSFSPTLYLLSLQSLLKCPLLYIITEITPAEDWISSGDFKGQNSIRSKGHWPRCWTGVPVFQWVGMSKCYARIMLRSPWMHNLHGHMSVVSWVHTVHSWKELNSWTWSHRKSQEGFTFSSIEEQCW